MKDVQKANGIPENAELIRIETNKKQAEIYKAGKVIIFRVFVDWKIEERIIRDDNRGHLMENDFYILPHFNDTKSGYFYYL